MQLVHESAGNTLEEIGAGKDFHIRTPAAQQLRMYVQMGLQEIKKPLHSKRNGL
jgi:hypothetical protein